MCHTHSTRRNLNGTVAYYSHVVPNTKTAPNRPRDVRGRARFAAHPAYLITFSGMVFCVLSSSTLTRAAMACATV